MTPSALADPPLPVSVFISYSHDDEEWREALEKHLSALQREGKIQLWHNRAIEAGTDRKAAIQQQLETAQVVLLLISPSFMASNQCYELEMRQAMQRHHNGTAHVIPILLRPCDWQGTSFSPLQILPTNAKPITTWPNPDEAFLNTVQDIRRVVESLQVENPDKDEPTLDTQLCNYNPQTFTGRKALVSDLLSRLQQTTRLVWITGISGIGKTTLGGCLTSQACHSNPSFRPIYWELSQTDGSDFAAIAAQLLAKVDGCTFNPQDCNNPTQLISRLVNALATNHYWLQLDALEAVLDPDHPTEFADPHWLTFFRRCLGETPFASRLVLTAQALPESMVRWKYEYEHRWHAVTIGGLSIENEESLEFFENYKIPVTPTNQSILNNIGRIYEGHPLALRVIAGEIYDYYQGDVIVYWNVNRREFEQVERCLSERLEDDETEHNEELDRQVRDRVRQSLKHLPSDALTLLCCSAVYQRAVPKRFWLAMLGDRPLTEKEAAYRVLRDRALVEEPDRKHHQIRQHNLIRSVAYDLLRVDTLKWHAAERQAAQLWLKDYQPIPESDPTEPSDNSESSDNSEPSDNLKHVQGFLEAFRHYCNIDDWETANELFIQENDSPGSEHYLSTELWWLLFNWGYYRQQLELTLHLKKRLTPQVEIAYYKSLGAAYDGLSNHTMAKAAYETLLTVARDAENRLEEGDALGNLGGIYYSFGEYQTAMNYYQQALNILQEVGSDKGKGDALGNLAGVYVCLGDYRQAMNYYHQHLQIAREIGDRQAQGFALGGIGNVHSCLDEYAQAIACYQQYLDISKEIGDRAGKASAFGRLGGVYACLGDYQRAIEYHQQQLTIAKKIGNRTSEASALGNLGGVYAYLGDYQRAIEYHQQQLTIAKEIGDRAGEGAALGSLGNAYQSLGQYQQAIDYHQQHLAIAKKIGDRAGEGAALGSLGNVYQSLGQYQQAIDYHQQHLAIAKKIGDRAGEGNALGGLGNAYDGLGDHQQALSFHQQHLAIAKMVGDRAGEAGALANLGDSQAKLEQYSDALKNLQAGLDIVQTIGARATTARVTAMIGQTHFKRGAYSQAITHFQIALKINQAIGDSSLKGECYGALGETYFKLKQYGDAKAYLQQALAIAIKIGAQVTQAETLKTLAELHHASGEIDMARRCGQKALALATRLGIPLQQKCQTLVDHL